MSYCNSRLFLGIFKNSTLYQQLSTNFSALAPICFLYEGENSDEVTSTIRSYYFGNSTASDWITFEGLRDVSFNLQHPMRYLFLFLFQLFSDAITGYGMHRFAKLASAYTKLYRYKFSYTGRYSHIYYPGDKPYGN